MLEPENTENSSTEAAPADNLTENPAAAVAEETGAGVAKKKPAAKRAAKAPAKRRPELPRGREVPPAEGTAQKAAQKTTQKAAQKTAQKAAPKKATAKRAPKKVASPVIDEESTENAAIEKTADSSAATAPSVLFQVPAADFAAASRATADASTAGIAEAAEELVEELADEITVTDEELREVAIDEANIARKRRRRGRRGRGGRSNAGGPETEDDEDEDDAVEDGEVGAHAASEDSEDDGEDAADGADGEGGGPSTKRRRRRRRSGGGGGASGTDLGEDDPPNTVVHVRTPRSADSDDDGVKGVKGSTRLEAKRQRRRDGRDNNRRRPPILTESEFLARREAVDRVMAVRQKGDRTQIAVLEDGVLVEHYVTRASTTSYVGNIYLGRVQNVLPSMEAAFIDISKGRNGVLYAGEVNWDAAGLEGKSRNIESALKSGDVVLVQVTKDPIGHKGARLTSQISLPGRFLVYVPGGGMTGISRKLPDTERHRLKGILKKIVPEDAGVIIRTAAEGATEEELTHDVQRLQAQWEQIKAKTENTSNAPMLVHGEPDLAIRVVRDVFNEDFKQLIVEGDDTWSTISGYVDGVAPDLRERVKRHVSEKDLFHELRVDEQLMKALDRKVWLPSGGSLVIDRTEAMTVIDVNTGKFVGSGGNLEQTVTRNNLEAAEEIVRQLRLRDVGGIVVIDFIDMVLESNRELVLRRLTECLGRDRTKHQVAEVTSLGLVQMTRKRVGEGLLEAFSEPCEHCRGRGVIVHTEPVERTGQAPNFEDDMPPQGGKSRRKRGGAGNGGAAAPKKVVEEPPEDAEAKAKRLAAMNAIHSAAAVMQDDDDLAVIEEIGGADSEAAGPPSEFIEAVAEGDAEAGLPAVTKILIEDEDEDEDVPAPESIGGSAPQPATEAAAPEQPVAQPLGASAPQPAVEEPTALDIQEALEDQVDPMAWLEAEAQSLAADSEQTSAVPKRRRRAASRPAGPPQVG
ncbi:MAG TPA: Rne/Rng family ribonuclease [Jatrophihabitans sp.]